MAEVIRRKGTATNQRIGVVSFDTDAGATGRAYQNAGEEIRSKAYRIDAAAAEKAGTDAANAIETSKFKAFDADGNPVALKAPEGFGRIAREAYQKVVEQRFVDTMDTDIRLEAQRLRVKHDRNPLGFQNEMDAYLQTFSKTSDGRFKEYVNKIGNAVKESTYVGLLETQRNRSRKNNGEFIAKTNDESLNKIAVMANNGVDGTEDALAYAYQRAVATQSGVDSDILIDGATENYIDQSAGQIASSFVIGEASRQNLTQLERAELTNLISTFGASLPNVKSDKVKKIYQQTFYFNTDGTEEGVRKTTIQEMIKGSNRRTVMGELNAAFSDADNILAIERRNKAFDEELTRVSDQEREDKFIGTVFSAIDENTLYASQQSRSGFAEGGDLEQTAFNISRKIKQFNNRVDTEVIENSQYNTAEGQRDKTAHEKALILPFIKRAAATGDSANFIAALQTMSTSSDAYAQATLQQQEAIVLLDKYNLLDENTAGEFSAEINKSTSATVEQLKRENILLDLDKDARDLLVDYQNGKANVADIRKYFNNFDTVTKGMLGVAQIKEKLKQRFEVEDVQNTLNNLMASPTNNNSSFMKSLAYYIRTGKDGEFLKTQNKEIVDNLIKDLLDEQKFSIASRIEKEAVDKYGLEEKARKEAEFAQEIELFRLGQTTPAKASEVSQLILNEKGFNIANRDTWTEDNLRISALGMPENIVNSLKTFTNLGDAPNADNLLDFWGMMFQYRTPKGDVINTTERFFSDEENLKLRYALGSRVQGRTANAQEAMTETNKLFQEPTKTEADLRRAKLFASTSKDVKNVQDFLRHKSVLGRDYDLATSAELGAYTEFLIASNLPYEQIKAEIKQKFEQRYKEAQYVLDQSRPVGSKSRTRHALDAYLPPAEKEFFVNSVESQLSQFGFTLYDHVNERPIANITGEGAKIPVVLMPMFPQLVRPEDQTFMPMKLMFVDDLGTYELQEIIIHEGTEKQMTIAFQISDEMKNYIGSADSVGERLSAEELKKLFDQATTLLGGNRAKPVPLY
tara:strand:+ start:3571 stop:6657 length:3087 start_codon:yes stop_codon:yes gene_type:complete